ncbi:spermidine synthase [Oricola sp.]|uniref:spermidine synthase n=1 Tax=Oricola sp. TaxID=1979950 RepID=UPI0025F0556D|nr:spermidine synthase [Oricola sp.]MCI5076388.1 spermidine synthase [Oricola sp.]
MQPWIELDTATVPGDGQQLRLIRRGDEYSIMTGPTALMNSRQFGSEEALARLARERVGDRKAPAILIGGLGMGFTLRAALAEFGADARITVAELVPAVVEWARGPLSEIFKGSLDDPRVAVHVGDVAEAIHQGGWDAILLDVDNGPEGLTRDENDALYGFEGLALARRALTRKGILAVWSSHRSPAFTKRLNQSGFAVEEVTARARGKRGPRHTIWIATA